MIKTGRYGQVSYDPTGAGGVTLVPLISITGFKLSLKTDFEDVSCFQDDNKVYVPGLRDISGTLAGYYNSDDFTLFEATESPTPGLLELMPNNTAAEIANKFSGLAYLDCDLDATVKGAPKVSGTFKAGGPWTIPTGTLTAHAA